MVVLLPLLVLAASGGMIYGHVVPVPRALAAHLPAYHARPRVPSLPAITRETAVTITMPSVESNLGIHGHYLDVVVSFNVTPVALTRAGASATAGGSGGTSSTALNNRIAAMITTEARQQTFRALQTPAGVDAFRQVLLTHLQAIFGTTQVDGVLFPTLITQ